ncbi:hypothetical protein A3G67_00915 [Candidatus Roizmanbacteria bacterium RIFCSPLOWO2_12_FULL_40_12]|uniref:Uncharacterized protein n=1 Tax=Candidatus Roizmanbacteria bacterium RIFCSPLOWO2_01_FULL_40_42 TaxID=1802066 RepID=A0A1F7J5U2_9BACT|nr:MAG: hypothetical protein A2779_02315 [Candidatus Roizmanbacteria bacterium RIFCSPHIGHO2_01_FULL_40_98]OGK28731.1 MAG: hypothetical protein A3C31_00945 [Candidatus Roizmanbacteria bacterium RIFCSPHIGHO2_02_FULL_40_53]OGK30030.1 MAG: hypothetical protein A2W49_01495 [Candidatus Roizmanbacteria bacterium RIFCSPHIGHO2_12_41_18]OGK36837.1 MAG: hypothetical protein A3E69_03885 [Candidatus Roizmanbacteria bacterium RIFCSPHIGHO2_12_FULL_40_130]OGK50981.1 MAG: hypothetical protein A3B50_03605 [Candi
MSERLDPMAKAYREMPLDPVERLMGFSERIRHMPVLIPTLISTALIVPEINTTTRLIGGGILAVASVVDHISTKKAFLAEDELKIRNIESYSDEANPLVRKAWEKRKSTLSPSVIAVEGVALVAIAFVGLLWAIPMTVTRTLVARCNLKAAKRMRRGLGIAENDGLA